MAFSRHEEEQESDTIEVLIDVACFQTCRSTLILCGRTHEAIKNSSRVTDRFSSCRDHDQLIDTLTRLISDLSLISTLPISIQWS